MKARVKTTGEIIEAELKGFDNLNIAYYIINGNKNWILSEFQLEFLESDPNPDYWARLEHTYAGQFMQAMIDSSNYIDVNEEAMADASLRIAHALVEKYKKEERK